tara:strand:+ start:610 stop:768 length:159 start_codon:yes stop_codon:yes gene_type:complete
MVDKDIAKSDYTRGTGDSDLLSVEIVIIKTYRTKSSLARELACLSPSTITDY